MSGLRRLLGTMTRRRTSALVVAVPQAEPIVARWRQDSGAQRGDEAPAHVTVLYPFLPARRITPATHDALNRAAGSVPAFDFTLGGVGRFPGVVYLAPDVTAPFAVLLAAVQRSWPDLEPYGGEFDELVPHLTIHQGPEPDGLTASLEAELPILARADALSLIVQQQGGGWATEGRFALG